MKRLLMAAILAAGVSGITYAAAESVAPPDGKGAPPGKAPPGKGKFGKGKKGKKGLPPGKGKKVELDEADSDADADE